MEEVLKSAKEFVSILNEKRFRKFWNELFFSKEDCKFFERTEGHPGAELSMIRDYCHHSIMKVKLWTGDCEGICEYFEPKEN